MNKNYFLSLSLVIGLIFFMGPVYADGMVHIPQTESQWRLLDENGQMCFINHENGTEKMIIAVGLKNAKTKRASWIFPVPSKPSKTEIDVLKRIPQLYGEKPKYRYWNKIERTSLDYIGFSQLYPLPFTFSPIAGVGTQRKGWDSGGVEIHEHIEKAGLTTELITAEEESGLYKYLEGKNLTLPSDSKKILEGYVGKNYSFVASWISDFEKFSSEYEQSRHFYLQGNPLGIVVNFPSENIYYPLKPTSVYGEMEIPITIYSMGWTNPSGYPKIKDDIVVSHYYSSYYDIPEELKSFFNQEREIKGLRYTEIKINTKSKYLTRDLWMEKETAEEPLIFNKLKGYVWVFGMIIFTISSCLAGFLTGKIIFKAEKISKRGFALLGLANFLSLLGLALIFHFGVGKRLTESDEDVDTLGFVFTFSIMFIVLMFLFSFILYLVPVILI